MKYDIKSLTIDEKLRLLVGADFWHTSDANGKLPALALHDGPCGLRQSTTWDDPAAHPASRKQNSASLPNTAMPTISSLSYTWNPELAYLDGEVIGDACVEADVDILLAPGVNIKRSPLCGRNFEYVSEDPYIAGVMGKKFIEGVQSRGVGTSLKHFCLNNTERERRYSSSEVDERTIREIYLPAFERAVEAKPWTVMCSYNQINGIWASENRHYLNDILRGEFGFDGLIVSDWDATRDTARTVKASLDLTMPYREKYVDNLKEAYERGELTESEIDERVKKILELIDKTESRAKTTKYTPEERHAAAVKIAEESIVLLKNDNNTLPIKGKKLLVVGKMVKEPSIGGGGSAYVFPRQEPANLASEIEANLDSVELLGNSTMHHSSIIISPLSTTAISYVASEAMLADDVILCIGNDKDIETEGFDRTSLRLAPHMEKAIHILSKASKRLTVVLYVGSPVDMSPWIDEVAAVVLAGFGGEGINEAVARVLTGKISPSGKLTETYPLCLEDTPAIATRTPSVNTIFSSLQNSLVEKYTEGIFVGYRYYDTAEKEVLFPFGHGLSYADFRYTGLSIKQNGDTEFTVSFTVTNTSDIEAKETVQLYVSDLISAVERPAKELKGFKKITLAPGESKTVELELDYRSFAYYNVSLGAWHVENGDFDILVGSSSRDIRLAERITIELPRDKQYTLAR
ncbi:MAG: glycoside hydrolase family 3 C-terminal domain-containing protein [Clostridia bacterium]|nr:glycoside hydrolase family 3 C-terminal domain-containing protein [Clostridia bacterium]